MYCLVCLKCGLKIKDVLVRSFLYTEDKKKSYSNLFGRTDAECMKIYERKDLKVNKTKMMLIERNKKEQLQVCGNLNILLIEDSKYKDNIERRVKVEKYVNKGTTNCSSERILKSSSKYWI